MINTFLLGIEIMEVSSEFLIVGNNNISGGNVAN